MKTKRYCSKHGETDDYMCFSTNRPELGPGARFYCIHCYEDTFINTCEELATVPTVRESTWHGLTFTAPAGQTDLTFDTPMDDILDRLDTIVEKTPPAVQEVGDSSPELNEGEAVVDFMEEVRKSCKS